MAGGRVFFTLGTDVHPFERLITWTEELAADPAYSVRIQHGTSRPALGARNIDMMTAEQFHEAIAWADVVVAQGGPGAIMEARKLGRHPIVVPRDPTLGEHVDDHQGIFSEMLADRGWITLATTRDSLRTAIDTLLASGGGRIEPVPPPELRFGPKLDAMLSRPAPRAGLTVRLRRARAMVRQPPG